MPTARQVSLPRLQPLNRPRLDRYSTYHSSVEPSTLMKEELTGSLAPALQSKPSNPNLCSKHPLGDETQNPAPTRRQTKTRLGGLGPENKVEHGPAVLQPGITQSRAAAGFQRPGLGALSHPRIGSELTALPSSGLPGQDHVVHAGQGIWNLCLVSFLGSPFLSTRDGRVPKSSRRSPRRCS
jgi:hypothetical protein